MKLKIGDVVEIVRSPSLTGEINREICVGDIAEVCVDNSVCMALGDKRIGIKFYFKIPNGHSCRYQHSQSGAFMSGCEDGYGWFMSKSCVRPIKDEDENSNMVMDIEDFNALLQ